jgi:hypothetical protein
MLLGHWSNDIGDLALGLFLVDVLPYLVAAVVLLALLGILLWRRFAAIASFRDNLCSPIPTSVSNLRFVPLEEQIHPHPDLMFRFDIDPADLDAI